MAFVSSTPLLNYARSRRVDCDVLRCTLAPERSRGASKETSKSYRVLPADLPESERPPLPVKHSSIPVVGFILENMLGLSKGFEKMRDEYGDVYRADYFLFPQTYVTSYQGVVDVLNDADVFECSGTFPGAVKLIGEDVLIQLDGARHASVRAILSPAFSPALLPVYFKRITERTQELWERVYAGVAAGKRVKLEPLFREHYLGIIIEITTGVKAGSDKAKRLRNLFATIQSAFMSPPFGPIWSAGVRASEEVRCILIDVIDDVRVRRADTIANLREYGDEIVKLGLKDIGHGEIDVLLVAIAASGLPTTPDAQLDKVVVEKLCGMILMLWFAGYSTAAAVSTSATFEAGWDDDFRGKLVLEQDALVGSAGGERAVTYEQTGSMPLLDAYLKEVLRTHPPGSGHFRRTSRDIELHGKFIPKNTIVFAHIKAAQSDPAVWKDPQHFDPQRFVREKDKSRAPPLLAFGGPRSPHYCIGAAMAKMMMKVAFATLLREYIYSLDPKQSRKYNSIPEEVPSSGVVLEKFEKRM